MKVLITSGGTQVPIDDVRSIKNFSSGKFGNHLAREFLIAGHSVTHVRAIDAPNPFQLNVDLVDGRGKDYASMLEALHVFSRQYMNQYRQLKFTTYDEYYSSLSMLFANYSFDAILLAAAVSDAAPVKYDGKLATENVSSIAMKPTEKIITKMRNCANDSIIVGFKLTSEQPLNEMLRLAHKQMDAADTDMCVANDLRDLAGVSKTVYLVKPNGEYITEKGTSAEIAKTIVSEVDILVQNR